MKDIGKFKIFIYIVILSLTGAVSAHSEFVQIADLGGVELPDGWSIETETNGFVTVSNESGASVAEFRRLENLNGLTPESYLLVQAEENSLIPNIRIVSSDLRNTLRIDNGIYVLGTNLVDSDSQVVSSAGTTNEEPSPEDGSLAPRPSEYKIIALYTCENQYYRLICCTTDLPDGAMELTSLQRTWKISDR